MANWIRNAEGTLVRRQIIGWGRQSTTVTTTDAERTLHAIERRDQYRRVAACGADMPNGVTQLEAAPEGPRCPACEGVALDLLGIPAWP